MEKWLTRAVIFTLTFVLLSLIISSYQSWKKKTELKQTVIHYNHLLERAFVTADPTIIEPYVSMKESGKIARYIFFLKQNNKKMEAKLKEIKFISIRIKGKTALVKTSERWVYRYLNIKTRREIESWKELAYLINYTLYENSNHWFVGEVSVEKEKEAK